MKAARCLFILGFLVACRATKVQPAPDTALRIEPNPSELGEVRRGAIRELTFTIHNDDPRARHISVDGADGIEILAAPDRVDPVGDVEFRVRASFTTAGEWNRSIFVREGDVAVRVGIHANVVDPPECAGVHGCVNEAVVDGNCVSAPLADGTSCDDPCLVGATCFAGICRGTQKDCDDGNACTIDSCSPGTGCIHAPRECGGGGTCLTSFCDPISGCSAMPAPDGTSCGDGDCQTARVCMSGTCQSVSPVPDGTACGPSTPCRPNPRCVAGQCVAGSPLPQMQWLPTYGESTPAKYGAVDAYPGEIHSIEATATTNYPSTFVRRNTDGGVNYFAANTIHEPAYVQWSWPGAPHFFVTYSDRVDTYSTADGGLVGQLHPLALFDAGSPSSFTPLAYADETLFIATEAGFARVDPFTGQVLWRVNHYNPYFGWGSFMDEDGTTFTFAELSDTSVWGFRVQRVSPEGGLSALLLVNDARAPVAVHRGVLYASNGKAYQEDGGVFSFWPASQYPLYPGHVLIDDVVGWAFSWSSNQKTLYVGSFDPQTGTPIFDGALIEAGRISMPVLASNHQLVTASNWSASLPSGDFHETRILELSPAGVATAYCTQLEKGDWETVTSGFSPEVTVADGWFAESGAAGSNSWRALHALPISGLAPGHGWVTESGSAARDYRAH